MKKLLLIISLWTFAMTSFLHAQLLDVTVNLRSSLGVFESSEVKNFKVIPWIDGQIDESETINVAADGSVGLTKMRIYNMVPFPILQEPFSSLDARMVDFDDINPDPKYFGSINIESVTDENILLSYDHPSAIKPDFEDERYYDVFLQIGRMEFLPESNEEEWISYANWVIRIYRPPVLFVHGLWSNSAAFADMDNALYESELYGVTKNDGTYDGSQNHTLRVNYEETNDFGFLHNQSVVPQAIAQLLHTKSKVIAHKVDVVCHSMGGVLTRLYLQNILTQYNNDINRVITCNTPHSGAQSANLLLDPNLEVRFGYQLGRDIICPSFGAAEFGSCYNGAVSDLRAGIPGNGTGALLNGNSLNANKVPSFALTTTESLANFDFNIPNAEVSNSYQIWNALQQSSNECGQEMMGAVYNGLESDWVVTQPSQQGGLPPASTTNISEQIHNGSVAHPDAIRTVLDLLNKNPNGLPFTKNGFNPPEQVYGNPVLPCGKSQSSSDPSLKIVNPTSGDNFIAGNNIQVTLSANEDIYKTMVIFQATFGRAYVSTNESGDLIHDFEIGEHLIGDKNIIVIGFDEMGVPIIASQSVQISVEVNATLDSISVYPETILTTHNFQNSIEITGHYSDGIDRNIKSLDGLEYNFNHAFAEKGVDGAIKGVSMGIDTLRLEMEGVKSEVIRVIVVEGPEVSTSAQPNNKSSFKKPGKLDVHPNPASGLIQFETEGHAQISIFTFDGRLIKKLNFSEAGEQSIDTSMFLPGSYIIRANDGQQLNIEKIYHRPLIRISPKNKFKEK